MVYYTYINNATTWRNTMIRKAAQYVAVTALAVYVLWVFYKVGQVVVYIA
jgi:hypothetical protein